MKKVISLVLSFIAASTLVAVATLYFASKSSHVQEADETSRSVATNSEASRVELVAEEPNLSFNLIDEQGAAFTQESLKGKISIVNFVFRSCTTLCPFVMSKTRGISSDLKDYFKYLRMISITVDPTNDTQSILREWQDEIAVDGLEWKFLSGEKDEVLSTIRDDFKQSVMENAANMEMPIAHSSYLVLVNQDGKIAGFYDSNDNFKMKELTEAAAKLAATLKTTAVNH